MRHYEITEAINRKVLRSMVKEYEYMSRYDTKTSIDAWYQRWLSVDEQPFWMRDGQIVNWQAAMSEWIQEQNVDKLQVLDDKWRNLVSRCHYLHYLINKEAHLQLQQINLSNRRQNIVDEIAETQKQIGF